MTLKYRKLSSEGEALMPGAASTQNRQIWSSRRLAAVRSCHIYTYQALSAAAASPAKPGGRRQRVHTQPPAMTTSEALAHFNDTSWQLCCLVCCHGCCWFLELLAVCPAASRICVNSCSDVQLKHVNQSAISADCMGTHLTQES
jgi:hypothetical protein